MKLDTLRTHLEKMSDHLVDAENEITTVGDHPVFSALHQLLDDQLDLVVDLMNEQDEENRNE